MILSIIAVRIIHGVFELATVCVLLKLLKRPPCHNYTTPGHHKLYIGIPAFFAVITSSFILHTALNISRWGAFSSSIALFGLVYGFLDKNLHYTTKVLSDQNSKILEALEIVSLCVVYAISDYYHTQQMNFEDYTILIGVGLPMCIIGHVIGSIGGINNNFPQAESKRPQNTAIVLWWLIAIGHGFSEYAWVQYTKGDDVMIGIAHVISGVAFAFIVSKMNARWVNSLLQYMISYVILCVVALYINTDTVWMIKEGCLTHLPMAQLTFWLWVLVRG